MTRVDKTVEPALDIRSNTVLVQVVAEGATSRQLAKDYDVELGKLAQFITASIELPTEDVIARAETFIARHHGDPRTQSVRQGLFRALTEGKNRKKITDSEQALLERLAQEATTPEGRD